MTVIDKRPWEILSGLLESDSTAELEAYLSQLNAGELVRSIFRLSAPQQQALMSRISADSAAEIIEELPDKQAAELLDDMAASDAADIVEVITSENRADILGEMTRSDAAAILDEMEADEAASARHLLEYDTHTAGGLMQTEFIRYSQDLTVGEVFEDMAKREREYAEYGAHFIYVLSEHEQLAGVLRLRDVVFRDAKMRLRDIVLPAESVTPTASLEELSTFFAEHQLNAVPVIDPGNRILGVVRRRALDEALVDRAEGERLRQAGIVGGEEFRSMPLALRSRRRLSWLSINIVLNLMAASVIAMYQDTLSAVIALAVFLPIVSDMSGCSGNQAVAVSLRELSLGVVVPRDVFRVWIKEAFVGVINGLALGVLVAIAAVAWQGNPWLGLVVGAALAINTIIAVSIGGTVPLILRGIGVDPALAAGPILTTITDMCGFALVLGFATLALPLLT